MANTPAMRERIIVSAQLMVPSSCCGNFNEKAVLFRQSINSSLSTGKLQAELVTKTITEGFGIRVKADADTDGKKREFTGDSRPGVESNEFGYRWETGGKWEPGSRLVLSPSFQSREGMGTEPNFGWLPPEDKSRTTFEEMLRAYREKPKIKLSKYKVNPRTDEVIPDSEKIIDPFGMAAGLSYEEKQQALRKYDKNTQEEKRLPGRSLESRVPGGSLLSRAAAVFGILRDENNKFRCPPGTPAANQFTDASGSNCFGFSASKFSRFAARKAAELTAQGEYTGLRQNAADFFRWIHGPRSKRDPALAEKCAFYGIKIPEWRNIAVPENLRLFKNGAIRGQDDIARQKAEVVRMYDALGIDADDPDAPVKALKKLKEMHSQTGGTAGWDIQVLDVSGKGDELLTDIEIKEFVKTRLSSTPGWNRLSSKEQERLLKSDFERYKTTQRAMLETLLDQFMTDPGSMRGVGRIEFNFMTDDEAGTSFYRTQNGMKTAIHINMGMISANQETMLPNMGGDERLAISAVGARSEAEGRLAVADFMVNADHTARGMAGLLDGVYGFSSHIMLHEIAHHKQSQVFLDKIQKEITEKGFITVAVRNKKGAVVGERQVKDIKNLTGTDLMSIMTGIADSINIESLNDAMTRIQAVAPLAGAYPRDGYAVGSEVWALEASAELWALRERGIIFGDDVDAALEWMDNMSFSVAARDRTASDDADGQRKLDDVFDIPADPVDPDSISDEDIDARATAAIREELKRFKTEFSKFSEDEMFEEAAIIGSQRDASARQLESLEAIEIDPSLPADERDARELLKAQIIKDTQREYDFHAKRYDEASKIWRKKFGIGASGERKRFDDEVYSIRKREGLLDSKEMADIARRADLDDLRDKVKSMPEKKTISLLVDDKVKLSKLDPSSEEFKKLADEIEVIKEQYVENMKSAGDTRTKAQIKKDLDKKVNDTINPPSKPKNKFKSTDEARKHGTKERARVKATPEQKKAMKELGDVAESDVGMLLDPVSQTRAGRAINKRNARLKKLGLKVDKTSSEEGDVVQQVENLLIPTMEAIDGTSVGEPFEMEAIIDFESGVLKGKIDGKEVSLDQFISGRVITSRTKKTDMPERGKRDPKSGKTKRRVILSVREKDRGLFPTTGGDSEQKFVAPPGRIRIIGKDADGTIRAEISYQKDTVEVVDSLAENLSKNTTDAIWARSHGKKIQAMADKYVTKRRSSGKAGPGPRSDSDESASTRSKATLDKVTDAGGGFADYGDGESNEDWWRREKMRLASEGNTSRFSSGATTPLFSSAERFATASLEENTVRSRFLKNGGEAQSSSLSSGRGKYKIAEDNLENIMDSIKLDDAQRKRVRDMFGKDKDILTELMKEIEPHESLSDIGKELVQSLSIHVTSNDIPVITAEPNPIFNSIIPDRRDWRDVEAPAATQILDFVEQSYGKNLPYDDISKIMGTRDELKIGLPSSPSEDGMVMGKILRELIEKTLTLRGIKLKDGAIVDGVDQRRRENQTLNTNAFHGLYLLGITDPAQAVQTLSRLEDQGHDAIGHLGTGRGFDRHGEWANVLAVVSVFLDSKDIDLSEQDRERLARSYIAKFGFGQLGLQVESFKELQGKNRDEDFIPRSIAYGIGEALKEAIIRHPGTTRELLKDLGVDAPVERASLSSGAITPDGVLGRPSTRQQRTESRTAASSSIIRNVKDVLGGGGKDGTMSRGDIHPEVAKFIADTPEEEIIAKATETAYRMHEGFDRRVRVRATDSDIDKLASGAGVRSSFSGSSADGPPPTRRAQRLAQMGPEERSERLSSGRTIDTSGSLAERRRQEGDIAKKALEVFNDVIDGGKNINDMSDDEISKKFGGAVRRSARSSISEKDSNLYEVDDVHTAIAMMMLGHHVEVKEQDIRLTEQAQKAFEKEVKSVAKNHIKDNHPEWISFQEDYAKKNPDADLDDPKIRQSIEGEYIGKYQADLCSLYNPANNLMCSGHIGIDRAKMPQTNGRSSGHKTKAISALKNGIVAGKWEPSKNGVSRDRGLEIEFADELDKVIKKQNAKRTEQGKPPVSDEEISGILYGIIADKHSLKNEMGGKTAAEHRADSFSTLSDRAKEWLYENTDWNDTEVNLETPFIDWLNGLIKVDDPENGPAVRRRDVDPSEYAPSQQQLVASKVDGTAQTIQEKAIEVAEKIRKDNPKISDKDFRDKYLEEMRKEWFMQPILTTKDSYILDGHHRWAGIVVANRSLPEELRVPLAANEVQTDIIEGLTLGKVFQDAFGIKEARLGAELPWEVGDIEDMGVDEFSNIAKDLTDNAPKLIDAKYEQGDYIQLGSVGLTNNPDYAQAAATRQRLARFPAGTPRAGEFTDLSDTEMADTLSSGRTSVGSKAKLRSSTGGVGTSSRREPEVEAGSTIGLSSENYAREYYSRIGIPDSVDGDLLPVSGYLVHKSHTDKKRQDVMESRSGNLRPDAVFEIGDEDVVGDGLTALGDIEIVLRPGVSERTAYGRGNSISSAHRPVRLNSRNREDVADALLNSDGVSADSNRQDAFINMISASLNNDFSNVNATRGKNGKMPNSFESKLPEGSSREPFEAQILGGFDISDVEQVNIPFKRLEAASAKEDIGDVVNTKTIADRLRSAGFSPEEIEYFYSIGGSQLNTESMAMLRNYRASQKMKTDLAGRGFNNVKFAHPTGFNIEDPRSHSKSPIGGDSAEATLIRAISDEIIKAAKELLNDMKKTNKPTLTTTAGGLM